MFWCECTGPIPRVLWILMQFAAVLQPTMAKFLTISAKESLLAARQGRPPCPPIGLSHPNDGHTPVSHGYVRLPKYSDLYCTHGGPMACSHAGLMAHALHAEVVCAQ